MASSDLLASVKAVIPSLDAVNQTLKALDGCCQDKAWDILLLESRFQLDRVRADVLALLRRLTKSPPVP